MMAQKKKRPAQRPSTSETIQSKRRLVIEVVWDEIQTVQADVLLVGHYLGVLPQTAERKLDELISGSDGTGGRKLIITELTRRAAIRGDLGEVVFFPAPNGRLVALAGMGPVGMFGTPQVRVLARSVAQVTGLLPAQQALATVLIGSGKGNLKVKDALHAFLEGLVEALDLDPHLNLSYLKIVERDLDRALEILIALKESAARLNHERNGKERLLLAPSPELVEGKEGNIPADFGCAMMLAALAKGSGKKGEVGPPLNDLLCELPKDLRETVLARLREVQTKNDHTKAADLRDVAMQFRLREPDKDAAGGDIPSRVAFWRIDNDIRAAAITNTTTVTERDIPNRGPLVEKACEKLQEQNASKLEQNAASLCQLLVFPTELKEIFKRADPLVIEVDRSLGRVQWEALPAGLQGDALGLARPVSRQLRTFYSPRPFQPTTREGLKALVIGDPGGSRFELKEAREEAVAVRAILQRHRVDTTLLVGAPEDGTGAGVMDNVLPADYFDVVMKLLNGEFDIVHYSGHATFDPGSPARSGWVFKDGTLTAHELAGMERPPKLVVANACLSSQTSQQTDGVQTPTNSRGQDPKRGDSRLVAGLADEFFKQGVSDYIGAAWEVPSAPAKLFATEFYTALLSGGPSSTIGAAVQRARKALHDQRKKLGGAWAAYQHYGDPTRVIVPAGVQGRSNEGRLGASEPTSS
jgi:hypothetical protein